MPSQSRTGLLTLTIVTLVLVGVASFIHNSRGIERTTDRLVASARLFATPQTTVVQAREWLERNDFHVLTRDGVWVSSRYLTDDTSKPPDFLLVRGVRQLRGFLPIGYRWVELIFQFKSDGAFDTVRLDPNGGPPPPWSKPGPPIPTTASS